MAENPFVTDDQLAHHFGVSVATIRLDRQTLSIPEARERIRQVASVRQDRVRSLYEREVVGEVVELRLNRSASSVLRVTPAEVFARTGIVRGHVLFAQVNSLATAVIDADVALTAKSELRYYSPVRLGDAVWARADVIAERFGVVKCRTSAQVGAKTVLEGWIWMAKTPAVLEQAAGGKSHEARG